MATNSIRLDQALIEKAKALDRTPPKQIEHWAKIGEIAETGCPTGVDCSCNQPIQLQYSFSSFQQHKHLRQQLLINP